MNYDLETLKTLLDNKIITQYDYDKIIEDVVDEGNHTVKNALIGFKKSLDGDVANKRTISAYLGHIELFLKYIFNIEQSREIDEIYEEKMKVITKPMLEEYFSQKSEMGHTALSLKTFNSSIKKFIAYLNTIGIEAQVLKSKELRSLSPVTEQTINALHYKDVYGIIECASMPYKAMISLAYEAGLRQGEVISIRKEDINYKQNIVVVRNANGGIDRYGYFTDECKALMQRCPDRNPNIPYLFQSNKSDHVSRASLYKYVKIASNDFFLKKNIEDGMDRETALEQAEKRAERISMETFRNSKRVYLFSIGKSVRDVQAVMGDENYYVCKQFMKLSQIIYSDNFKLE